MKYNNRECARWLLIRGSHKDLPNNEGLKPVDVNRANKCDEETIKMVETFKMDEIIPPPPDFSLLPKKEEVTKEEKEKKLAIELLKKKNKAKLAKKKRTRVVKVPPSPPMLLPTIMVSEISSQSSESAMNLQRSRSTSTPSIITNEKPYQPKLEKAENVKNIYSTVSSRPSTEPNNRSPLRHEESLHHIYDEKLYSPLSLSSSNELFTPQTATNPEDRATASLDTPRTAVKRISVSSSVLYRNPSKSQHGSSSSSSNSSYDPLPDSHRINRSGDYNSSRESQNEDSMMGSRLVTIDQDANEEGEKQTTNSHHHPPPRLPKIVTAKRVLQNFVLSNPNLTDSPRSAIYVPSPKKMNRNANFASATCILNAFIKNDTSTILDDILNIDNENDDGIYYI